MTASPALRSCPRPLPGRPLRALSALAVTLSVGLLPAAAPEPAPTPPVATAPLQQLAERAPDVLRADLLPRIRALAADLARPPAARAPDAAERQRIEALQNDLQRLRLAWLDRLNREKDRRRQGADAGRPVETAGNDALIARANAFQRQVIDAIDRLQTACGLLLSDQPARRATGLRRLIELTPPRQPPRRRPGHAASWPNPGHAGDTRGAVPATTLLDISSLRGTRLLLAARTDAVWGPLRDVTDPDDSGAPVPGDTAVAAPLLSASPRITALAEALATPARIVDHVRHHIAYEPYFGAVKGAERVLLEGAGNDVDIASALISLLRAAGVPCRYVYGTIRLDALQAAAWLGVAPEAVPALLTKARLPHRLEGTPDAPAVVLDHIWVKAYVDYLPHRASAATGTDGSGSLWIDIDASFKQHLIGAPRDLAADLSLNPEAFLANIREQTRREAIPAASGLANAGAAPGDDHVANLPQGYILDEVAYRAQVLARILNAGGLDLRTVFRQRRVAEPSCGLLPCSDLYQVVARGAAWSTWPAALTADVDLAIRDRLGRELLRCRQPVAAVAGRRLILAAEPAGEADRDALAAWTPDDAAEAFPAYLVEVVPTLSLDGQTLARSDQTVTLGALLDLHWRILPAGSDGALLPNADRSAIVESTDAVPAGSRSLLMVCSGSVPPADLAAARDALAGPAPSTDDWLAAIGVGSRFQADALAHSAAAALDLATVRLPSVFRVSLGLSVTDAFGLPFTAAPGTVQVCAVHDDLSVAPTGAFEIHADAGAAAPLPTDLRLHTPPDRTGAALPAAEAAFTWLQAVTASAMDSNALERFLNTPEARSPLRLLRDAAATGHPVLRLAPPTPADELSADALDSLGLTLEGAAREAVLAALRQGCQVVLCRDRLEGSPDDRAAIVVTDPRRGTTALALLAPTQAQDLVAGSEALPERPPASLPALLADAPPALDPALAATALDWLDVLPDATLATGLAYVPAVAHLGAILAAEADALRPSALLTVTAAIALMGRLDAVAEQPWIVIEERGPSLFSPHPGPGHPAAYALRGRLCRTTAWEVTVSNAAGEIVRTFAETASPSRCEVLWDGRTDAGGLVPDGLYTLRLLATHWIAPGAARTQTAEVTTRLDATPPAADLKVTAAGQVLRCRGQALDDNLQGWCIAATDAANGAETVVAEGVLPVAPGQPFADLAPDALPPGAYTFTVTVTDAAGNATTACAPGSFTVVPVVTDTTPPQLTVVSRATDATAGVLLGLVPVQVMAYDDSGIAAVTLRVDGCVIPTSNDGTEPYLEVLLDCTALPAGVHTLEVSATDTAGQGACAGPWLFLSSPAAPDSAPPEIDIDILTTGPDGLEPRRLVVRAVDNQALAAIELRRDGQVLQSVPGDGGRTARLEVELAPGGVSGHDLVVVATDTAGNRASRVLARADDADRTPPRVTLSLAWPPGSLDGVHGEVTIQVQATDASGIRHILLDLDGVALAATGAPAHGRLVYRLDTAPLDDGPHALGARAVDCCGNLAEAVPVTFTTANPIAAFAVTPAVITPDGPPEMAIHAEFKTDRDWHLTFQGPSAIPERTGRGRAVDITLPVAALADGLYTVILGADGIAERPERPCRINRVSGAPTARLVLGSDPPPTAERGEPQPIRLRDGVTIARGVADDPDETDAVAWRIDLHRTDSAFVQTLTPDADTSGWNHSRRPATEAGAATLGTLDLTLVPNGLYDLVLTVRGGPDSAIARARVALDSGLKVGAFAFAQQDILMPLPGFPIALTRTYDSLQARSGTPSTDFGPGWSFALADMLIETDETTRSEVNAEGDAFTARAGGGRNITLDLPNGRRGTFTFRLEAGGAYEFCYRAHWDPPPGVAATLTPTCSDRLIALPGALAPYWEAGDPRCPEDAFEFPGFTLTLSDGTAYDLVRPGWALQDKLDPATGEAYPVPAYDGRLCLSRIRTAAGQTIVFHREGATLVGISQDGQADRALALERDPSTGLITAAFAFDQVDSSGGAPRPAAGAVPQVRYTYAYGIDGRRHLKTVERLRDRARGAYDTISFDYYGDDDPTQTAAALAHLITAVREPGGTPVARLLYDDDGRLVGSLDATGQAQSFDHDLAQRTETHVDRLGNPTVHGYDTRGNVVLTIDPLGHAWRWTYDDQGHLLTATDPLGNTTRYEVDARGNRTAVTDPLGNTTRWAFDPAGHVTAITNPLGQTTRWERDPAGRPTRVVDPLGRTTAFSWDSAGRWTGVTAPDGTRHLNDLTAFPEQARFAVETADGKALLEWHEHYDNAGRLLSRRTWTHTPDGTPVEERTDCTYDADGNLLRLEPNHGQAMTWEYDQAGRCIATIGATGLTARRDLDPCGQVRRVVLPDGQEAAYLYDANGRLLEETVGARTTRYTYDAAGRLICLTRDLETPLQTATWFLYDACGRVVEQRCDERWQRWEYDACGRVVQQHDWSGASMALRYDAAGRPCAWRSGDGPETTVAYDSIGRRTALDSSTGEGWRVEYDLAGRPIRESNRDGRVLEREFDALGQLTRVRLHSREDPTGGTEVRRHLDSQGRLVSRTDASGHTTQFDYDQAGRLVAEVRPDGRQRRYRYADSRLVQVVDPDGRTTRLDWDDLGRITQTAIADPATGRSLTRQYRYDDQGRLCRIEDDRGVTLIDYDEFGREVGRHDPVTGSVGYAWDAAGRCVEVASATQTVACDYDPFGRLAAVRCGRDLASVVYDDLGRIESVTLPGGLTRLNDYDAAGRLARVVYVDGASGADVASYAVEYDAKGRCRRATASDGLVGEFSYNAIGMLTRETWHDHTGLLQDDRYEVDAAGNRVRLERLDETLVYGYDSSSDRLLSITSSRAGETQFDYDDNGALIAIRGADGTRQTLTYDPERRLESWSRSGGPAPALSLEWDCDAWGNRVAERATSADGSTRERLFRLDTASGAVPQRFDECSPDGSQAGGHVRSPDGLLWSHKPDTADWQTYLVDPFQNVRHVLDAEGTEVGRAAYDAFGNTLPGTALQASAFGYRSEAHHLAAGMVHLRARDYLTSLGRFTSSDPFPGDPEEPLSLHRYLYADHDPVHHADPSGRFTVPAVLVGAAIGQHLLGDMMLLFRQVRGNLRVLEEQNTAAALYAMILGRDRIEPNATLVVHGIMPTGLQFDWSRPFTDTLTDKGLENQDFYEFNWTGFDFAGTLAFEGLFALATMKTTVPAALESFLGVTYENMNRIDAIATASLTRTMAFVQSQGYINTNILSHSWGTFLSHRMLRTSGFPVQEWFTYGSPLGRDAARRLRPGGVAAWHNAYSTGDPICTELPRIADLLRIRGNTGDAAGGPLLKAPPGKPQGVESQIDIDGNPWPPRAIDLLIPGNPAHGIAKHMSYWNNVILRTAIRTTLNRQPP